MNETDFWSVISWKLWLVICFLCLIVSLIAQASFSFFFFFLFLSWDFEKLFQPLHTNILVLTNNKILSKNLGIHFEFWENRPSGLFINFECWGDGRSQRGCKHYGCGLILPFSTMDPSICNLLVERTDFSLLNVSLCFLAPFLNLFQHNDLLGRNHKYIHCQEMQICFLNC